MKKYLEEIVDLTITGAFGYSGQKCSATKRVYIPEDLYEEFIKNLNQKLNLYKLGDPKTDFIPSFSPQIPASRSLRDISAI